MKDEIKLKILEYWIDNPDKTLKLPPELENKVKNDDLNFLIAEIDTESNTIGPADFLNHAEKIRRKIKQKIEIESIKLQDEILKRQIDLQEDLNKKQEESVTISSKQNKIQIIQLVAFVFLVFLTGIIGWVSNNIANTQTDIIKQQTEIAQAQTDILKLSNPPYEAYIEIIPDDDDLIIPAWDLVDSNDRGMDVPADKRWGIIDLFAFNFGKMDSKKIVCFPRPSEKEFFSYITPNNNFNLSAGNSENLRLHVFYEKCNTESEEYCDKNLVNTGYQNITLDCKCYGCMSQREFKTNITFCAYNKYKTEECPT